MKPLSVYYDQELRTHPGRVVTQHQTVPFFGQAFVRATTMSTAINVFKKTGILFFNSGVFDNHDFAAAGTTSGGI